MAADPSFGVDADGLRAALAALERDYTGEAAEELPPVLPETGLGEAAVLERLAPLVLGGAARLDTPLAMAHMDPPTPWITWALTLWNARLNQNLLHPAVSPFARQAEATMVDWLAPTFGMDGGHMTPGSSVANLTALWAARDVAGVRRVVASSSAHLSIAKAAQILGLAYEALPVDAQDRLMASEFGDLSDACLVLTAGTTGTGAIDPLSPSAAWTHVDAAWAGPLRLSDRHKGILGGVERADSVVVSAHKWLFQPKESAFVLFRDSARANAAISFGGAYLAAPNVGIQGSHGAMAIPLIGTLMAWGRTGLARRIELCMANAVALAEAVEGSPEFELFAPPESGVVVFRPHAGDVAAMAARLPPTTVSTTAIDGETWLRSVAANPNVDMAALIGCLLPDRRPAG
ncbi:MAG: pyridoxal-dependent decarboxylase [Alphaproteobacteria bacterium]|jgi:glutamate/tyrosine decarboxylase-like PLP-dependent enzyme|nr:pyridoxal-dependent decarboxylase [Alphaproteobacteria bacterium]